MTVQAEFADPLLLKFATSKPDELAALLAQNDLNEIDELLQSLPEAIVSTVASRLPSWQLNSLLATMDARRLGLILGAAQVDEAVILVSHLHELRYPAILSECDNRQRQRLQDLLHFPSNSLAALVSTRFVRVLDETLCGTFCEQLGENTDTRPRPILIVDKQGKYRGMVNLQAVYVLKNRTRSITEVSLAVKPLNGVTDAKTALSASAWLKFTELPVVDNRQRLLGVVSRATLLRVVGDSQPMEFNLETMLSEIAAAFLVTCGDLLESILGKSK